MKRRNFILKTIITSGAVTVEANTLAGTLIDIMSQQKFNFMTQSHPNLTLINDFFQAYTRNDMDGIKKVLAANIKWHIPGKHPLSGTKTGVNEVLEFFQKLNKGAFKAEPIVMGVNDTFVIDCHRNWSNLENEDNLNSMSCLLWRIENNKIAEVHNFPEDQHKVDSFFNKLYN
jgi:ketosteroid isomerase-like protein